MKGTRQKRNKSSTVISSFKCKHKVAPSVTLVQVQRNLRKKETLRRWLWSFKNRSSCTVFIFWPVIYFGSCLYLHSLQMSRSKLKESNGIHVRSCKINKWRSHAFRQSFTPRSTAASAACRFLCRFGGLDKWSSPKENAQSPCSQEAQLSPDAAHPPRLL